MSKDAYYFSHDSNAHHDPKILKLRMSLGWEGYGIYWAIIESLRNQENYMLSEDDFSFLTLSLAIDTVKLEQMLSKCLDVGLLTLEDGNVFSGSLLRRMDKADKIRNKRKIAGALGGKAKANAKQVLQQTPSKDLALKEKKGKEKKLNETKEDIKTPKKTIEQRKDIFMDEVREAWNSKGGSSWMTVIGMNEFFEYWSEHGSSDNKMRKEKEKTFGVGRRLSTWLRSDFNKNCSPVSTNELSLTEQFKRERGQ